MIFGKNILTNFTSVITLLDIPIISRPFLTDLNSPLLLPIYSVFYSVVYTPSVFLNVLSPLQVHLSCALALRPLCQVTSLFVSWYSLCLLVCIVLSSCILVLGVIDDCGIFVIPLPFLKLPLLPVVL